MPRGKSALTALLAIGFGSMFGGCAALSGLDSFTVVDCPLDWCDASVSDGARADASAAKPDASDATLAADAEDATSADAGSDAAADGPSEDAGAEAGDGGCAPGMIACDAGCVDPSTPFNCGGCGVACASDGGAEGVLECRTKADGGYACVLACTELAPTLCDGGCVDTTSDPNHCGSCGNACPAVASAHASCNAGTCGFACDVGYSLCQGSCITLTTSASCGACGAACDPDGGTPVCAPPAVPDGGPYACASGCPSTAPTRCAGTCTDTTIDVSNCGGCGQACPTGVAHATAVCSGGSCSVACSSGYVACSGGCVDETSDPNNCGGCGVGHVCGLAQSCVAGVCVTPCHKTSDCPAGYACDGSTCTTSCSVNQACNGGCCAAGTCTSGLAAATCGSGGGACVNCAAQGTNTACVSGACGCNVATDCPPLNACSTALHSCEGLCGGANTGCNGGCCTNLAGGGTCVAGTTDTQCGATGGQCSDCQTGCDPGPHCVNSACACGPGSLDCLASACGAAGPLCSDAGACHM